MRSCRRRWFAFLLVIVIAAGAVAWLALQPYIISAAFLLDLAGYEGAIRTILPVRVQDVESRELEVPTRHGSVAARVYRPAGTPDRSMIVFPGVHAGGIDEPRLVELSSRLAGTGTLVLSVPLPELRSFHVTPRSTDVIEDAALWMTRDPVLAPHGRVVLTGVSFAGGLAVVAAGRPALDGRLDAVVSVGGHADLPRVLTYYCTGRLPDGRVVSPHDYGLAVLTLGAVDRLVPPEQAPALASAIQRFLEASSAVRWDGAEARELFAEAERLAETFPEPSRTIARWMSTRNVWALGRLLLPHVDALGGDPALSPARAPAPAAPVFLVHGTDDRVIPAGESAWLAEDLRRRGTHPVRLLLTPVLSHVETVEASEIGELLALVRFWTAVMKAGG